MATVPVSVILPVKNEEQNLKKCLPLLSRFHQVIVVDSKSTDETRRIAKKNGAEVHQFRWNGKYPKKRNWALQHISLKNRWVLFLDADEFVSEEFIDEVEQEVKTAAVDGFWIAYETYFMGSKLSYGDKLKKLSLFKHEAGKYEKMDENGWSHLDMEVHEQARISGRTGSLETSIEHRNYNGLEKYIERHNQYSSWEAHRFMHLKPNDFNKLSWRKWIKYRLMQAGLLPLMFFIGCYFLKLGFLDGKAGLRYAIYKSYYFYQIQTKITEKTQQSRIK